MTHEEPAVTKADIAATARIADLPLTPERAVALAELLSAWVPAANALGARMQADDLRPLAPPTSFTGSAGAWSRPRA